jgi:hypothetical protein
MGPPLFSCLSFSLPLSSVSQLDGAVVEDLTLARLSKQIFYYILLGAGLVSICSAAWALARAGVPRLPVFVLLGTVLSAYSHATPFGPLGSAFLFLAALWIELVWRKMLQSEIASAAVSPIAEQNGALLANVSNVSREGLS